MRVSQRWKTFENEVAKALSLWLFGDPKILRRSPCSGGWRGRGEDGDIILAESNSKLDDENPFSFEAKCRVESGRSSTGWHFEQLLTSSRHPILDWWYQLTESRPVKNGKLRMLIFSKKSGVANAYAAIGRRESEFLRRAGTCFSSIPKIVFEVGRCEDPSVETEVLYFFGFREFIGNIDARSLRSAWRLRNGEIQKQDSGSGS